MRKGGAKCAKERKVQFLCRLRYTTPIVDNSTPSQPEVASSVAPPGTSSGIKSRLSGDAGSSVPEMTAERRVRRTLYRIYSFTGAGIAACCLLLFLTGWTIYHRMTYSDSVTPDYSSLVPESDTYWTDRILTDIETARLSAGSDRVRHQRLQTFAQRTAAEAMHIPTPFLRAQAVTSVALALAQNDVNIVLDHHLQRLGDTPSIHSMRARTLISQALMHLRQNRNPAAQVALRHYNQLVKESDLKLNSPLNEESFFGAVTVLWSLNNTAELKELFAQQSSSATALGLDQQMRAYRLIAGEQARTGMILEALETSKRIHHPIEQTRAWTLILQCAARPPAMLPAEPAELRLFEDPPQEPPRYPAFAVRVIEEIFQYLAEHKDMNAQVFLLRRMAGSGLMGDAGVHHIFRQCLIESTVLHDRVKQPILRLLDDPESPTIRQALNLPPRAEPHSLHADTAREDWSASGEFVQAEIVNIDPAPLRTRADQQWVEALLAIVQSYQSIRRFHDADRVLKQALLAAQRFEEPHIRVPLLMRIAERQVSIGSIAEARRTFTALAPELNQHQKGELARLQFLARLFDDAGQTIASIETPSQRELIGAALLREQIRLHRLDDAEKTLALIPSGTIAAESQSRLNIAQGHADREDFNRLEIPFPGDSRPDWERHCIGLLRHGLLRLADQAADRMSDGQERSNILVRISQEYLLLSQAFGGTNDPDRTIRREIQQRITSAASRTGQPAVQTAILTEFLMHHTGHLHTEADRADGKRLWQQAMEACRNITEPNDQTTLFAQLIIAKNLLENPHLDRQTIPLFTRGTHAQAFAESNDLITECLALINEQDDAAKLGLACAYLARASAQIGRMTAAQVLIDNILQQVIPHISDHEILTSLYLSTIPALQAMGRGDTIPLMYRSAIHEAALGFAGSPLSANEFEWRMRESNVERIVRAQLENGFVDDAVESAFRLNEPMLRDRLLRTAIYIYLDHGNFEQAERTARRLMVKNIQDAVLQNIQIIKHRRHEMRTQTFLTIPDVPLAFVFLLPPCETIFPLPLCLQEYPNPRNSIFQAGASPRHVLSRLPCETS